MKKYTLLLILTSLTNYFLSAEDTTKIRSHNKVVIKTDPSRGQTFYPSSVKFPEKNAGYRKIYLYLEFGCAPGLKCGEWDYNNHIFLSKKYRDTGIENLNLELARFITPYGFYWNSSMNWKHGWYIDLTDYAYLLHDSLEINYKHSGYEANNDRGWTITLDFYCIQGENKLEPIDYNQFYSSKNAAYGIASKPFENTIQNMIFNKPDSSNLSRIKIIQTGHGMDQQENCAEFCKKTRTVSLNGNVINAKPVWRDNCGFNSLYPQAGTWLYDRAGWCPGSPVLDDNIDVSNLKDSGNNLQISMQNYSNTAGGEANWVISCYAFHFKDKRLTNDAEIDDVIAPSNHFEYLRLNPTCGEPILRIKNIGKTSISKIDFEYGLINGQKQYISVHANIPAGQKGEVTLEGLKDWTGSKDIFWAKIVKINQEFVSDELGKIIYSEFKNVLTTPEKIIIQLRTNNDPNENSYKVIDREGNVIRQKGGFAANTTYRDTVFLRTNMCYQFVFSDEGTSGINGLNKDGLNWWANTGDGTGSLMIRNGNTNQVLKNFDIDFGTKHIFNFFTTYKVGNESYENTNFIMHPNPIHKTQNLQLDFENETNKTIKIYNNLGALIYVFETTNAHVEIPIQNFSSGVYHVEIDNNGTEIIRKLVLLD